MKRIFVSFLAFVLMTPIAWAAEITVPKPSGNLNLQVGHPPFHCTTSPLK